MSRTQSNLSTASADLGARVVKRRTRRRLSAFHRVVRHAGKLVQVENRFLVGKDATVPKQPIGGPIKRTLDIVIALGALITLFPLFGLVAGLVKATDGGPIFYRHTRLGHGRRTFPCLKFRTMVPNGDEVLADHLRRSRVAAEEWAATRKLKSDPRITAVGATLRIRASGDPKRNQRGCDSMMYPYFQVYRNIRSNSTEPYIWHDASRKYDEACALHACAFHARLRVTGARGSLRGP